MKDVLRTTLFNDKLAEDLNLRAIEETIELLKPFWKTTQRSCFYPSSGTGINRVFSLDADTFIFADTDSSGRITRSRVNTILRNIPDANVVTQNEKCLIFEKAGKRGYFFNIRNREVLELIHQTIGHLDLFIGVRDGCEEGGNNECVNVPPFLELVTYLAPKSGMILYLDHSSFLDHFSQYNFRNRYISFRETIPEKFNQDPIGPTRVYEINVHAPEVYEWCKGHLRLTIEHENILLHQDELDVLIAGNDVKRKIENGQIKPVQNLQRFLPFQFRPSEVPGWSADDTLLKVLSFLMDGHARSVGITAFGEGDHANFLKILAEINPPSPVHLRFFHLEKDDFSALVDQIAQLAKSKIKQG